METCTVCEKIAKFTEIEGGNYYCAGCILDMYKRGNNE
jgi:hypothetical protein